MNIWLIEPFEILPSESRRWLRYSFLAEKLANAGHQVTWWSSNFSHVTKSFRSEGESTIRVKDNLHIILLKTPRYDKNISLARIWNHNVYAKALKTQGAKCVEAPDVIVANTIPLEAAKAAVALSRRFHARLVLDVQDIWPEAFDVAFPGVLRPMAGLAFFPVKCLANWIYDKADYTIAVSNTYLQRALSASRDKSKGGMVLPWGVDLKLWNEYLSKPEGNTSYVKDTRDEFWVTYIGTIGKSYDITTIIKAARMLALSCPNMRFLIAGVGPDYEAMRSYASQEKASNVTFTGLLSYPQVIHLLRQSDIGLNAIVASSRTSLTTKLADYFAAGLPIVNSVGGELGHLVKAEKIGEQYQAGDADSLAKAILQLYNRPEERLLMGQRARKLAEERFDINKEYAKFEEIIKVICGPRT